MLRVSEPFRRPIMGRRDCIAPGYPGALAWPRHGRIMPRLEKAPGRAKSWHENSFTEGQSNNLLIGLTK
jgi:hypothetical protein